MNVREKRQQGQRAKRGEEVGKWTGADEETWSMFGRRRAVKGGEENGNETEEGEGDELQRGRAWRKMKEEEEEEEVEGQDEDKDAGEKE